MNPGTRRWHDERGASLVEYALLVALIAVVCIGAVTFLGKGASGKLSGAGDAIQSTADHTGQICYEDGAGNHFWYDQSTGTSSPSEPGPCPRP